jgi:hypothetical protein
MLKKLEARSQELELGEGGAPRCYRSSFRCWRGEDERRVRRRSGCGVLLAQRCCGEEDIEARQHQRHQQKASQAG